MKYRKLLMMIICLIMVTLLSACALNIFGQEMPIKPLRLENETGKDFAIMGLIWDQHILLYQSQSASTRQAVFPKALLEGADSLRLIGITKEQQLWLSAPLVLKGQETLHFKAAQLPGNALPVALEQLPSLKAWQLAADKQQITASFQADTGLSYRIFVLGKGGSLSPSDWGSHQETVSASWEKGRGLPRGWLLLKAE